MKISSLSLTFLFLFMGISNAIGSFGGGGVSIPQTYSVKSATNVTAIPLAAGATFYGGEVENDFPHFFAFVNANQDGFMFTEFKDENGTWRTFPPSSTPYRISANVPEFHTGIKGGRPFRIKYVNGPSDQTTLSIQTYFGTNFFPASTPLGMTIGADHDAAIVRTVSSDLDLAFGRWRGMSEDVKFGAVQNVDAADPATDVWAYGDDNVGSPVKVFRSTATRIYLVSTSASDVNAKVSIYYLTEIGTEAVNTVQLNGQTVVNPDIIALDVNRLVVSSVGAVGAVSVSTSSEFSAGVASSPTAVLAFVRAGYNQSEQCMFTVPSNARVRIKGLFASLTRSAGSAGSGQVLLLAKPFGQPWQVKRNLLITTSSSYDNKDEAGLVFDGLTSVVMRLQDVSEATDTNLTGHITYELLENP